jgi:predicted protein tyrosine phosphatase
MTATAPPLVSYRITICGLAELEEHAPTPFDRVVSILDPVWPDPPAFSRFAPHRRVVYRFDDVVEERDPAVAPQPEHVVAILDLGRAFAAETVEHVLIHCHAGLSRSTAAAIALMAQDHPGREAAAFAELQRIRPKSWPNARMIEFADTILARGGALVGELRAHQRRIVAAYPEFAEYLLETDRAHEVLSLAVA